MLSLDVASTLLLLDQALEKGFEGDTIINGLAEHFRNLLLCKDARMAKLLDVPNDLKQSYNEKANQAPPSFILSSLNIINESELQYKNATNKRLHVEMCLIRLCFLQQSLSPAALNGMADIRQGTDDVKKKPDSIVTPVVTPHAVVAAQPHSSYAPIADKESIVQEPVATPATQKRESPTPAAAPAIPATPAGNRRVSMNMLADIDAAVTTAAANLQNQKKELSAEVAEQLFSRYKKNLQDNNKTVIYAQFSLMRVEVLPPDEVRIISPSELTDTYARDQRTALIDFYRAETDMIVRITTEIQEDEAVKNAQISKVLSKSEMYEVMAGKNPNLARLKDGLGMQIEY
jgi:DNA polymerase III subunit gamma/tau